MKMKLLSFLILSIALILSACSPALLTPSTPEPLTPAATAEPPLPTTVAPPVEEPTPTTETVPETGLEPVDVNNVSVEVGEGSPIPVDIAFSGAWPGLCSQLALVEQRIENSIVNINVLASPSGPDCPPDMVGLTFGMELPLNMVQVQGGAYSIVVNGVETSLAWDIQGGTQAPTVTEASELEPIQVEDLRVTVGVGSPIPVYAQVAGTWPGLCSQIARIEQQVEGNVFDITLLATADTPDCPPDQLGLPFGIEIPLNMVEMEFGDYTVRVNGVETTLVWNAQPSETPEEPTPEGPSVVAYIGQDGNVWVQEGEGNQPRQLTEDAAPIQPDMPQPAEVIQYYSPALSSDGRLLAYQREQGILGPAGIDYAFSLWVTDLLTGDSRQVLEEPPAGFSWKPGTHLLAYSPGVEEGYFNPGGDLNQDLAMGIWELDLDLEEVQPGILVEPERGYTLAAPVWSPDGRFLSFDEVHLMEGRGMFAYYDFENQEYVAWEEPIGSYSWSPDGELIAYDRMVYVPTGEERIYLREREDGEEQLFSTDIDQGYAFNPVFSPQGDRIAYLAELTGPDSQQYTLFVQDLSGGPATSLTTLEAVRELSWTADGESLVFTAGPFGEEQVFQANVGNGNLTVIAEGSDPALPTR